MEGKLSNDLLQRQHGMIHQISHLPHKILQFHDVDGLSQMILHELGHKNSFDLKKATYLVDNPDFDHLIGAAGFFKDECRYHKNDLWTEPASFAGDMKDAIFHNDVKKFLKNSLRRKDINLDDSNDVKELGHCLGMEEPGYFSWNMKHGNHGILIFDTGDHIFDEWEKRLLTNAAALLSLCSIV